MASLPTQRTLKLLRADGWTAAIVERWNPYAKIRQDLFGFIDIVALHPQLGILAVQTTSGSNVSARVAKIRSLPAASLWVLAGGLIEVHGWRKAGPRGKRKTWQVRRLRMTATGEVEG